MKSRHIKICKQKKNNELIELKLLSGKYTIDILLNELNKQNEGKQSYNETIKLKEQKQKICKEIQINQFYKEKSENMKGNKNHNFGKKFSEETKHKMSQSIRNAKGSVSDETILEVRHLIQSGKSNNEIQELISLPRHSISRIKNGNIVCRNEMKIKRKPFTQEQINISKRKIELDEILLVIEKCVEGMKPSLILNLLIEKRNQNNINNTLTIDIIKNIKRSIQQKKIPFYSNELTEEKYKYYTEIIHLYTIENKYS